MKKYFAIALAGLFFLLSTLTASAEEPVQIIVAEPSVSTLAPVQATVQFDPGPDSNTGPRVVHGPFDEGGHFVAGAGVYIMKPYFQNNPAFFTQTFASTGVPGTFSAQFLTTQYDFSWGLNAAPLIWLGYVSECGLGVRARWWLFDQRSATSAVSDPNTTVISASPAGLSIAALGPILFPVELIGNSPLFAASNLKLDVWDFEATGETGVGRWILLFCGGFRYAHLSQNYDALHTSRRRFFGIVPFDIVDDLSAGHNFNGAGPTIAIEARRPVGNSGLSLFANLRGSMLFGQSKQQVNQTTITQTGDLAPIVVTASAESVRDTVLPVAELEMGVEYSRNWSAVRPFLRSGLVAQTWFDAGSASNLDGNLGFLGLSVTAGLNY